MSASPVLVETTREPMVENRHRAIAAIADASGAVLEAWGDAERMIYPRSSIKMIQALPLVESGAAAAFRLGPEQLALACASHQGAAMHERRVAAWLKGIGLDETALLCGPQAPQDRSARERDRTPRRITNNCSGKHSGFLTLALHTGADRGGYIDPEGATQARVAEAYAEATGTKPPLTWGIDGCSAPNFAATVANIALAMARFADPAAFGGRRAEAARALVEAMAAHPLLVSGEGRACAELTIACAGAAVVKTGADGVFTGILPGKGVGFCLKIEDGNTAASEALCAALLTRLGALDPAHPMARRYANAEIRDRNGAVVGERRVLI